MTLVLAGFSLIVLCCADLDILGKIRSDSPQACSLRLYLAPPAGSGPVVVSSGCRFEDSWDRQAFANFLQAAHGVLAYLCRHGQYRSKRCRTRRQGSGHGGTKLQATVSQHPLYGFSLQDREDSKRARPLPFAALDQP